MAAPFRPTRRRAARRCIGERQASRQTVAQRAPVRGRHVDGGDAQRFDGVDAFQHGAHVGVAFGVQQQTRARLHTGDALHGIKRCSSLHHHELPADRAVVVGLPTNAAEHCIRHEHGTAPPAIELERARWCTEAQVELETRFDVASDTRVNGALAGWLDGAVCAAVTAMAEGAADNADVVMACSPAVFWKLALQQTTQQVGHGHALREGRHLDAHAWRA